MPKKVRKHYNFAENEHAICTNTTQTAGNAS